MAYTPINWQTGDTITAAKLNKCDNGWSVESSSTTLCEESVTTADNGHGMYAGALSYSTQITTDPVSVTWNGTEYTCNVTEMGGAYYYGDISAQGPVFTNYPFVIESYPGGNNVYSQTAGTYSIKIASASTTVETSANFQTAVNSFLVSEIFIAISNQTTWQAIYDAMTANKAVFVKDTDTDSVAFYMVTLVYINNGIYGVAALYNDGGSAAVRYYNANSANGAIYAA